MSLGSRTVLDEEDIEVMLAVARLAYATSDISATTFLGRKRGRGGRGRRLRNAARGSHDRVLRRACASMDGFICGGEDETEERLAFRIEERVCAGMSWIAMFFLRHMVSWAVAFVIRWVLYDLEADAEYRESR